MIYTHVCNKPGLSVRSPVDEPSSVSRTVIDEKMSAFKYEPSSNSR